MIGPDNVWLVYFLLACGILWCGWAVLTIGPIHHCDKCKHWWEAQQGAKIMGGVITTLDEAKEIVTVRMDSGETAECSLQMLRDLHHLAKVRALA